MNDKNRSFGRTTTLFVMAFAIMLAGFVVMSVIAYSIPYNSIREHAEASRLIIEQEETHTGGSFYFTKDYFTDDLMLNLASTGIGEVDEALKQALINYYTVDSKMSKWCEPDAIETYKGCSVVRYSRYWHGYILPLRVQLLITDLKGIRAINIIVMAILFITSVILIRRKISLKAACMFALSVCVVAIPLVPLCMQYSTCFYIMLVSVIVVLACHKFTADKTNLSLILFATGGFTAYMDFLTVPIITLGFPLAIALLSNKGNHGIKSVFICSIAWFIGYGGIWASKWILATIFTSSDIIGDAMVQISARTFETDIDMVSDMMYNLLKYDLAGFVLTMSTLLLCLLFRKSKVVLKENMYLAIIGCFPLIWYAILQNHSLIHFWFTWRSLSLTLFCWGMYCLNVIDFTALSKGKFKSLKYA